MSLTTNELHFLLAMETHCQYLTLVYNMANLQMSYRLSDDPTDKDGLCLRNFYDRDIRMQLSST